jgi:hypothetical protein
MNVLAQSNHWGLYYLQQSNIKKRPAKNIIVSEDGQPPEQEETVSLPERVVDIASSDPVKREIVTNAGIYVTTGEK